MYKYHKKNLFQHFFIMGLVSIISACALTNTPTVKAPPVDLKELDPFYLSFLKEQCRGYSLKEGTPEFDQCLMKLANENRDVNMYKYSNQYRKKVAKALNNISAQDASQATPLHSSGAVIPQNLSSQRAATVPLGPVTSSLMDAVKDCDQLKATPSVSSEVIGKLLVANEQSDNKLDLLANHNKITADQKPLIKAFAKAHYACFKELDKQIGSVSQADAVSNYMNTTDEILAQFYSGDTTIAQTNSAFLKAKALRDNALSRITK
ncbi:MAG: hypothetical protein B7Z60_00785 [Ferrovum sp. 37-45-19]|uniref:hypothetical protein n=1 Tax=Ferrovum sp. JA12 TaxID=1356299 RepID=UPI0007027986|nr:hypothetical protein [Ferrovum sp. JA12]OYV79891.1 MAG: hypothetical protein B7Z65_04075 [Ferrovum sp. 21-44-67]OYV95516.1 MAG: hypothetical protein B7Z60_00785 [Ferrovum sp. 37-45-19]OZB31559.1 MAG: hypothetical protein B7X47_09975 [Ferrovum sp. 34-44-207]HQT81314.1 hypothetical protein [Ferrovaceae bacterium]KRH78202.1 hypothetical protein FERRO_11820 [Ferrovum sp. JA12]